MLLLMHFSLRWLSPLLVVGSMRQRVLKHCIVGPTPGLVVPVCRLARFFEHPCLQKLFKMQFAMQTQACNETSRTERNAQNGTAYRKSSQVSMKVK